MIRKLALLCLCAGPALAETPVTIALDWTLNTNHIGLVAARDLGLYAEAGLQVEILPYADTSPAALVLGGVADFGYLTSLGFMTARAAGADLTALWATMQREAGRLVYATNATPPITRPADLSGRIYAGFGTPWEAALIGTMIEADGGVATWDNVVLGTGAYEALASGAVDFTLEVATWEGVNSALLARPQGTFAYADYGIPDQQNGYIAVHTPRLADDPDTITAFMRATQAGYAWAQENPQEAAQMLIATGGFPNAALVEGSMALLAGEGYLLSPPHVVGEIDPAKFTAMARFLYESGVLKDNSGEIQVWPGDVSDWYDQSWLTVR